MFTCEIDIGKPLEGWLNTAVVIPQYHDLLSHNDVSYWCRIPQYDIKLRVGKLCQAGLLITDAIQNTFAVVAMTDTLVRIALPRMKPDDLYAVTKYIETQAAEKATKDLQKKFRELLDL